jgi:hypothetical protein
VSATAQALNYVVRGLGFVLAGLVLIMGFTFAFPFLVLSREELSAVTVGALVLVFGVGLGLQVAGQILCLQAPERYGGKVALVFALGANVLALVCTFTLLESSLRQWLSPLPVLFCETAHVAILFFLKRLARALRDGDLEAKAESLMIFWSLGLLVPGAYLLAALRTGDLLLGLLLFPLGCLYAPIALILLQAYGSLIVRLRHALRRYLTTRLLDEERASAGDSPETMSPRSPL